MPGELRGKPLDPIRSQPVTRNAPAEVPPVEGEAPFSLISPEELVLALKALARICPHIG